jgi:hypothetical protein
MRYPDEMVDKVVEDYKKGIRSKDIIEKYKLKGWALYRILRRRGVRVRTVAESKTKYHIDENFFEKIDSHEKAQILGFIYADGCLLLRNKVSGVLRIALAEKDLDYLEWIKKTMKNEAPIGKVIYKKIHKNFNGIFLTTSCNKILADIQKVGITERKSLTVKFPTFEQVPEEFIWSFILGEFEGDGCIYANHLRGGPTVHPNVSIIGSYPFIKRLSEFLTKNGIKNYTQEKETQTPGFPTLTVRINTVPDAFKFYTLIYKNAKFSMKRKKEKFDKCFAQYKVEESPSGEVTYELIQRKEFSPETIKRIGDASRSRGPRYYKPFVVKDPDGNIYSANGMRPFAKEFGVHRNHMWEVIKGEAKHHKGWTKPTEEEVDKATKDGSLIIKTYGLEFK